MYHELWNASIVFLILGGLCFLAAQICNACSYRYLRYPSRAEARVIDIVAVPREGNAALSEYHNRLAAVFEFYADGRPIKVIDATETYPCPYRKNERVQICYDPNDPKRHEVIKKDKWKILKAVQPPWYFAVAYRLWAVSVLCTFGGGKSPLTGIRFCVIVFRYEFQPILRGVDTPTGFLVSGDYI